MTTPNAPLPDDAAAGIDARLRESREDLFAAPRLDQRAAQLREEDAKVAELSAEYPDWHIFKIAGGWGAILKAMETARTGNTLAELETAILRPDGR